MLRTPETMRRAVVLLAAIGWPCLTQAATTPQGEEAIGFLYVNNDSAVNSVRAFTVRRSGRIESFAESPFPTLGRGGAGGFPTFPSARPTLARKGRFLYAINIQSGSISGFVIQPDGALSS